MLDDRGKPGRDAFGPIRPRATDVKHEMDQKMIVLSNEQLYAAVKETAVGLEELGMKDHADRLLAALSVSSSPGEILGEIRLALQRIELGAAEEDAARDRERESLHRFCTRVSA